MDFIFIFLVLIANILTARLFLPYTMWMVRFLAARSNDLARKKYSVVAKWGRAVTVVAVVLIWVGVEWLDGVASKQSSFYSYLITALTVYFCVGVGQVTAILSKLYKNTENDTYTRQLWSYLLIPCVDKVDHTNSSKIVTGALVRLIAERVMMPLLLVYTLGEGAALAYVFVNTFARSDGHESIKAHGFADFAIKVNNFVSQPGYWVMNAVLVVFCWFLGVKRSYKGAKITEKCTARVSVITDWIINPAYYRRISLLLPWMAVLAALAFTSVYIFIQAVLAVAGLGEYIDFWEKGNQG